MPCNTCISCSEICDCVRLSSPDGSIVIDRLGCQWSLAWNPDSFSINSGLTFNDITRELCMEVNGVIHCVDIPDQDDQYLELIGDELSILREDGSIVNTIDLSVLQITFAATSSSLNITPGGPYGHTPNIEIEPSTDAGNVFVLGTDGKPYVPTSQAPPAQTPITVIDTDSIDLTVSGINNHTIQADVNVESTNTVDLNIGVNGITADLILDPTSTADVSLTPDGLKIDMAAIESVDVVINPIQGLSFTKSVANNIITFTPVLDYVYIASQVCELCPPPEVPCTAPTVTISDITDGTLTVGVTPLAAGDTYDISINGGISWLVTGASTVTSVVNGLTELTGYNIVVRLYCNLGGTVETTPQSATTLDCADISNLSVVMSPSATTASANLTWTPVTFMSNQVPQYKLSTSGTYSSSAATTSGTANITGLLNNRLYDFRIQTACSVPNGSTSNVIQQIALQCPTSITVNVVSDTSISYNFANYSSTSISNVKVDLLPATGTTVLQTQNKVPPSNTGTFTGLTPLTTYRVRITLQAQGSSQLFQSTCNPSSSVTTTGTIYARLDYEVAGAGTCTDVNTSDNGFRFVNAVWKTFSNSAGTIPVTPPAGTIINYDRLRFRSVCTCPGNTNITLEDTQNYNLTLTSNATTVPNSQKYSTGLDWFYCTSNSTGIPCTGGNPGQLLCIQNNYIQNYHEINTETATSVGTVNVVIL